jgi:Na+/proline symporter
MATRLRPVRLLFSDTQPRFLYDSVGILISNNVADSYAAEQREGKEVRSMGLGVSIFLIAVGAVLAFAIHVTTNGVDLHTIGYILMGAGALGIVLSLIFWSSWGGPGGVRRTTDVRTIDDRPL